MGLELGGGGRLVGLELGGRLVGLELGGKTVGLELRAEAAVIRGEITVIIQFLTCSVDPSEGEQ